MTATATTAQAATAFGVTEATIRTWCRIGAVKAAKVAGRWVIDTASLLARKTIAHQIREAREARARKAAVKITVFRYPDTRRGRMRDRKDNKWSFRADGTETHQLFNTKAEAEQAAASYIPPKPSGKTYSFPVRGERKTPEVPARGWSKASRRRSGEYVHTFMEDLTGVASPARPGQCHFCGLNSRTCDCR